MRRVFTPSLYSAKPKTHRGPYSKVRRSGIPPQAKEQGDQRIPAKPEFLKNIGIRRVISARTRQTVFGGSKMRPEVWAAMREANTAQVDMNELHAKAGARIAELTRTRRPTSRAAPPRTRAVRGRLHHGREPGPHGQAPLHRRSQERDRDPPLPEKTTTTSTSARRGRGSSRSARTARPIPGSSKRPSARRRRASSISRAATRAGTS